MLNVYRIVQKPFAKSAFTGAGSRQYPGRWNSTGIPIVYTSGSVALATLEMLVHLNSEIDLFEYRLFRVGVPTDSIEIVAPKKLPKTWKQDNPTGAAQEFGTVWSLSTRSLALCVPSVVVPHDSNYLLNPTHPDFALIEIGRPEKYTFDPRLFSRNL